MDALNLEWKDACKRLYWVTGTSGPQYLNTLPLHYNFNNSFCKANHSNLLPGFQMSLWVDGLRSTHLSECIHSPPTISSMLMDLVLSMLNIANSLSMAKSFFWPLDLFIQTAVEHLYLDDLKSPSHSISPKLKPWPALTCSAEWMGCHTPHCTHQSSFSHCDVPKTYIYLCIPVVPRNT